MIKTFVNAWKIPDLRKKILFTVFILFLFRLGCYKGEPITLISKKRKSCIVVIKDGRYNLDLMLSEAIII